MFEQTFNNIDNILRKDDGCGTELDYVEQSSWVLFLKYLYDLEKAKSIDAQLKEKYISQSLKMNTDGINGLHLKLRR